MNEALKAADALETARKALEFYANGKHIHILKGKIDWEAERRRLEERDYCQMNELYDGTETFVEDGLVAELALDKIYEILQPV